MNILMERFHFPEELSLVVEHSPSVIVPESKETLFELIFGNKRTDKIEVGYEIEGKLVKEANVVRCRNGAVVNYAEDYMRRRDPDSMRVADELPTDKPRFEEIYGYSFSDVRSETMRSPATA